MNEDIDAVVAEAKHRLHLGTDERLQAKMQALDEEEEEARRRARGPVERKNAFTHWGRH